MDMKTAYTDLSTGEALADSDPRTMATKEERIAAAAAEQAAFENRPVKAPKPAYLRGCPCAQCRHS